MLTAHFHLAIRSYFTTPQGGNFKLGCFERGKGFSQG
jgi:hypothetical protein